MTDALLQRGVPDEQGAWVVDGLLEASLRGIDTHGVRLFVTYLAELDGGRSQAHPELRWIGGGRAACLLDAGNALGLVAGRVACAEAVRLARELGAGAVAVRNSNHFGAASVYTLEMARQGVLGLAFSNSDALVTPYNSLRPLLGTNPLSMAVQGLGEDLFCADLATSQVSYSKVKHHLAHGLPLEPSWGDAAALKPLGGHKGECLGMMVEILCAGLAGMPFDHELSHFYTSPFDEPRQVAHFFLAFDIAAFREPGEFRKDLSRLMGTVRQQPAVEGERVIVPGDLESETAADRHTHGIPMDEEEWRSFEKAIL
jgi:ureidoglycolate dehydrogenase (NAD+)